MFIKLQHNPTAKVEESVQLRHPSGMGGPEIEEFLTHLAVKRQVSASTQNQALNAVVFL